MRLTRRSVIATTAMTATNLPLQAATAAPGAERVMLSIGYPCESSVDGARFMDAPPLSADVRAPVAHGSATALLRLPT